MGSAYPYSWMDKACFFFFLKILGFIYLRFSFFYFMCMGTCPVCMYVCVPYLCSAYGGQEMELDTLELELQLLCECWESNPEPLAEQSVLLNAELFSSILILFLIPHKDSFLKD